MLAIDTPEGRKAVEKQHRIEAFLTDIYPDSYTVSTPANQPALIDGLLARGGDLIACYEIKSRDVSRQQLEQQRNHPGSVIVTFSKLELGSQFARALCVPFLFVAHLEKSDQIFIWQITDLAGKMRPYITAERTVTQATINGEAVERLNAYLPLEDASKYQIKADRIARIS